MATATLHLDLNALVGTEILNSCDEPAFSEAPGNMVEMETGNELATVHVVFDFKTTYEKCQPADPAKDPEWIADGIKSVDIRTVQFVLNDSEVTGLTIEPAKGGDLHMQWCEAVLRFVSPHGEKLCERFV